MTIRQLYYFAKVAELGYYTKAADALFVSQPTLSLAISELEKELEVPLFQKRGRNIFLTSYGELFLVHTKNILQEVALARENMQTMLQPDGGSITISHISAMNATFIPDIVKSFYQNSMHHNIKLNFIEHPSQSIEASILAGKSDVGFGSKPKDATVSFYPVYSEELVLIANEKLPLAQKDEVDLRETVDYGFIAYDKQCGIRDDIDQLFKQYDIKRNILCEVVDNVMVTGLVSAGMGIAIVPKAFSATRDNVKPLRIKNGGTKRYLYMLWSEKNFLSMAVLEFIRFVKSEYTVGAGPEHLEI